MKVNKIYQKRIDEFMKSAYKISNMTYKLLNSKRNILDDSNYYEIKRTVFQAKVYLEEILRELEIMKTEEERRKEKGLIE